MKYKITETTTNRKCPGCLDPLSIDGAVGSAVGCYSISILAPILINSK